MSTITPSIQYVKKYLVVFDAALFNGEELTEMKEDFNTLKAALAFIKSEVGEDGNPRLFEQEVIINQTPLDLDSYSNL